MRNTLFLLTFVSIGLCSLCQPRYAILITEIMADPSPQVGLPSNEWIEIKNISAATINLQGWRIGDAAGESGILPFYLLEPDQHVIICTGSAAATMATYGSVVTVTSFPSLGNESDLVYIKSADGRIIHSIEYNVAWHANELKKEGGWTLEMINTSNPCTGSANWTSSIDPRGGTPGTINSVNSNINPITAPQPLVAYTTTDTTLIIGFMEPVDSSSILLLSHFSIDGGSTFIRSELIAPTFKEVKLTSSIPFIANQVYTVTLQGIQNCSGVAMEKTVSLRTGIPDPQLIFNDCIINEILFNPPPGGSDYVEIFNRSQKIIDLSQLSIANRNASGNLNAITRIFTTPSYIFPGDYIVITPDADDLHKNYFIKDPAAVKRITTLPSYPDAQGTVVLLNSQGNILDEVRYHRNWHFKLIDNDEGVALERIDPEAASQEPGNWHSAASTAGYGTPGYINSQYRNPVTTTAKLIASPRIFSPDNDGWEDITALQYQLTETGYVANVTIFDAAGRPVRHLVKNALLSTTGYWNWDGLNDKGEKLSVGTYIFFTEIFNLQGKRTQFKNAVQLIRRLN